MLNISYARMGCFYNITIPNPFMSGKTLPRDQSPAYSFPGNAAALEKSGFLKAPFMGRGYLARRFIAGWDQAGIRAAPILRGWNYRV
jgi:hypothetical protein